MKFFNFMDLTPSENDQPQLVETIFFFAILQFRRSNSGLQFHILQLISASNSTAHRKVSNYQKNMVATFSILASVFKLN